MWGDPYYPAEDFEAKTGVKGIAGRYFFPCDAEHNRTTMQYKVWELIDMMREDFNMETTRAFWARNFGESINRPTLIHDEIQADKSLRRAFDTFKQTYVDDAFAGMYTELALLNPKLDLLEFNRKSMPQLRHVVDGVISGINTDDIAFYLKQRTDLKRLREGDGPDAKRVADEKYKITPVEIARTDMRKKILQKELWEGQTIGWQASPATLDKIWGQVKDRPDRTDSPEVGRA